VLGTRQAGSFHPEQRASQLSRLAIAITIPVTHAAKQKKQPEARTLAAMAWTLRREGCHNINWVGGEVVIHLHATVSSLRGIRACGTVSRYKLAKLVDRGHRVAGLSKCRCHTPVLKQ
jgi:hypothetical protein